MIIKLMFLTFILFLNLIFENEVYASDESVNIKDVVNLSVSLKLAEEKKIELDQILAIDELTYMKISVQKNLSLEEANSAANARLIHLNQLFSPQTAPYSGMITKSIKCKSGLWVEKKNKTKKSPILFVANLTSTENFVYGSCGAVAEPYTSQYLLLFCNKNKTLVDFRFFTKKPSNYNLKIPLISCKN